MEAIGYTNRALVTLIGGRLRPVRLPDAVLTAVDSHLINVGGRPHHPGLRSSSTFEMTIRSADLAGIRHARVEWFAHALPPGL